MLALNCDRVPGYHDDPDDGAENGTRNLTIYYICYTAYLVQLSKKLEVGACTFPLLAVSITDISARLL
jgi:hypothetical protein